MSSLKSGLKLVLTLFLLNISNNVVNSECPDDKAVLDLLAPCICGVDETIVCAGDKPINLKEIFAKLSTKLSDDKKDFEHLVLSNTAIEELPESTFGDIYFREIKIENALNLKTIDANAFTGTDQWTESIIFYNSPKFANNPNTHLFDILNKFKKIEAISIGRIGIAEVPAEAFKQQDTLVWICLNGSEFTKISEKAFSNLNALTELHVIDTSVKHIPKDVFAFTKSDVPLDICLYKNSLLTDSSFDPDTFSNIGRPTTLDFSGNRFISDINPKQMTVLEEKVFKPFLTANKETTNQIHMNGQQFDCNDCRNSWLKKETELAKQVLDLKCADAKDVSDATNFAKC